MIAYVESNFVLQLALGQEEAETSEAILQLAEQDAFRLVVPALAIWEPFSTISFRRLERDRIYRTLKAELELLRRSPSHQHT